MRQDCYGALALAVAVVIVSAGPAQARRRCSSAETRSTHYTARYESGVPPIVAEYAAAYRSRTAQPAGACDYAGQYQAGYRAGYAAGSRASYTSVYSGQYARQNGTVVAGSYGGTPTYYAASYNVPADQSGYGAETGAGLDYGTRFRTPTMPGGGYTGGQYTATPMYYGGGYGPYGNGYTGPVYASNIPSGSVPGLGLEIPLSRTLPSEPRSLPMGTGQRSVGGAY